MALHLGASLASATLHGTRPPLNSPSAAASSGRGRPRVTCQAAFGPPKPGAQRVREQSPSKVQALAAPAIEREVLAQSPPSPPQQPIAASSNILEVRRADLERLILREAARDLAEQQQQQQQQPQQPATAPTAASAGDDCERQAAGASGPRSLHQRQWQEQRGALLVPSTRQARGRAASAAAARAVASQAAAARPKPAAKAATVTSWVLDCSSRRARCAKAPLAPVGGGAARPRRGASADPAAEPRPGVEAAALDGLSEQTREDMAVLIEARAALRHGRMGKTSSSHGAGPDPDAGGTISAYMAALGHTGVLTRAQEARLSVILQSGLALERLGEALAAQRGCPPSALPLGELAAAGGAASGADAAQRLANQREAKDLLMQHNVRLVVNIAKRYAGNGIDVADLIPEGMAGLSKSLDRFDPSKGFKFSTYAHWWIRQAISRAVCDQARAVRLPSHVCEVLYRINRATTTLVEQSESDEPPSYEAIAAATGLPLRRVAHYLRLARLPGGPSRDRPSSFLHGTSLKEVHFEALEDLAEDDGFCGEESEEEAAAADTLRHTTDLLLSTLEKRERNILRLRYGLLGPWAAPDDDDCGLAGGGGAMSLGEVASAYGLSRERIRQIEDKAMRALRKPWRQQLAEQVSGGVPVTPSSLTALASVQALATHADGGFQSPA